MDDGVPTRSECRRPTMVRQYVPFLVTLPRLLAQAQATLHGTFNTNRERLHLRGITLKCLATLYLTCHFLINIAQSAGDPRNLPSLPVLYHSCSFLRTRKTVRVSRTVRVLHYF